MADRTYESADVESLKLIVQSQIVLTELHRNQSRLENMIAVLEATTEEEENDEHPR